ncbi:head-tail connector protein [Novosphingopyxis sp. YJ-S2-01]|uniref:head-tail connector protein n=1 Tax=Novosphingopyxis sp. YJ-S2-01 TaxID=2794021 RepID=UPI0018DC28BE|nr:head-tail connector protein [Novosphingopyxis sp. YJ-S2-01]MBH9537522.1 phage gp6-like head-tail connector protein [Novosphingopyxis sp. YJ-S2-01]
MALPVTLEDAKKQLRVIGNDEDDTISGFIPDAAAWVEAYTGHLLEPREVVERFSGHDLNLRYWPVAETGISVAVGGVPIEGARLYQTVRPAAVLNPIGTAWPYLETGSVVEVTYTAGYASPDDVPRNMVRAMLILISAYDADREGGEIFQRAEATAKNLCRQFKAWRA